MIEQALSFPRGVLVLDRHDEAKNEWLNLGSMSLTPSDISYKPQINIRKVQGEATGWERDRKGRQPNLVHPF